MITPDLLSELVKAVKRSHPLWDARLQDGFNSLRRFAVLCAHHDTTHDQRLESIQHAIDILREVLGAQHLLVLHILFLKHLFSRRNANTNVPISLQLKRWRVLHRALLQHIKNRNKGGELLLVAVLYERAGLLLGEWCPIKARACIEEAQRMASNAHLDESILALQSALRVRYADTLVREVEFTGDWICMAKVTPNMIACSSSKSSSVTDIGELPDDTPEVIFQASQIYTEAIALCKDVMMENLHGQPLLRRVLVDALIGLERCGRLDLVRPSALFLDVISSSPKMLDMLSQIAGRYNLGADTERILHGEIISNEVYKIDSTTKAQKHQIISAVYQQLWALLCAVRGDTYSASIHLEAGVRLLRIARGSHHRATMEAEACLRKLHHDGHLLFAYTLLVDETFFEHNFQSLDDTMNLDKSEYTKIFDTKCNEAFVKV